MKILFQQERWNCNCKSESELKSENIRSEKEEQGNCEILSVPCFTLLRRRLPVPSPLSLLAAENAETTLFPIEFSHQQPKTLFDQLWISSQKTGNISKETSFKI